jgi:hypothetical protein
VAPQQPTPAVFLSDGIAPSKGSKQVHSAKLSHSLKELVDMVLDEQSMPIWRKCYLSTPNVRNVGGEVFKRELRSMYGM